MNEQRYMETLKEIQDLTSGFIGVGGTVHELAKQALLDTPAEEKHERLAKACALTCLRDDCKEKCQRHSLSASK